MELIFAILISSFIFVLFKLFPRFEIDTFQAIVVNYFVAFLCGMSFSGPGVSNIFFIAQFSNASYLWAGLSAILFIGLFLLMGLSSQRNGLSSTSVAVKMSMALTVMGMIFFYQEKSGILNVTGILCAILGVLLMSISFEKNANAKNTAAPWMLLVLFVGSGVLDFQLNFIQDRIIEAHHSGLFTAIAFGMAGMIGLVISIYYAISGQLHFQLKNLLAGILLGIPNFFSIYFLLLSYQRSTWNSSTILAIINVSIVIIASVLGLLFFKEKWGILKILGFISSIVSILLLFLSA